MVARGQTHPMAIGCRYRVFACVSPYLDSPLPRVEKTTGTRHRAAPSRAIGEPHSQHCNPDARGSGNTSESNSVVDVVSTANRDDRRPSRRRLQKRVGNRRGVVRKRARGFTEIPEGARAMRAVAADKSARPGAHDQSHADGIPRAEFRSLAFFRAAPRRMGMHLVYAGAAAPSAFFHPALDRSEWSPESR